MTGHGSRSADAERTPRPGATPAAPPPLLSSPFDIAGISELRRTVSECAAASGLADQPLDDFVLAVHELVTNAVRHGGGSGRLRLWRADGWLVCEVADSGGGIVDADADGRRRPSPRVAGGWGLWLARQLSDRMTVTTGSDGTSVRISAAIPPGRDDGAPSD